MHHLPYIGFLPQLQVKLVLLFVDIGKINLPNTQISLKKTITQIQLRIIKISTNSHFHQSLAQNNPKITKLQPLPLTTYLARSATGSEKTLINSSADGRVDQVPIRAYFFAFSGKQEIDNANAACEGPPIR